MTTPSISKPNLALNKRALSVLGKAFEMKVNCFCISEFFFRERILRQMSADEMLDFAVQNFRQTQSNQDLTLFLVWSRNTFDIPVGEINVERLSKRTHGYPFGLILEHSFVKVESNFVFQKADPSLTSKVELIEMSKALDPYRNPNGFEVTLHAPLYQHLYE